MIGRSTSTWAGALMSTQIFIKRLLLRFASGGGAYPPYRRRSQRVRFRCSLIWRPGFGLDGCGAGQLGVKGVAVHQGLGAIGESVTLDLEVVGQGGGDDLGDLA